MGAESWVCQVPHQADIANALDQQRWSVLRSADYLQVREEELAEFTWAAEYPESFERMTGGGAPTSPDEAVMWSADSGTHSIMDVREVVDLDDGRYGIVFPADDAKVAEQFGTNRPTTADLTTAGHELADLAPRSQVAIYLIGYEDNRPNSIHFAGFTGD